MHQKRILPDRREKRWNIDIQLLRDRLPQLGWLKNERLLQRDIEEMGEYLPHWIITVGQGIEPLLSSCCSDNLAPTAGELRCILCDRANKVSVNSLLWLGLLPINLDERNRALRKLTQAHSAGKLKYPFISAGGKQHLMVPVVAEYPNNWPYGPPRGHYLDRQYIDALKLSHNHSSHIIGTKTMCLYANSQWNDNNGIMHVVANRMAPHAFALLRLANDESNVNFFDR